MRRPSICKQRRCDAMGAGRFIHQYYSIIFLFWNTQCLMNVSETIKERSLKLSLVVLTLIIVIWDTHIQICPKSEQWQYLRANGDGPKHSGAFNSHTCSSKRHKNTNITEMWSCNYSWQNHFVNMSTSLYFHHLSQSALSCQTFMDHKTFQPITDSGEGMSQ